jgi:3-oxoacyl-[acyl-carrier protein] reductase
VLEQIPALTPLGRLGQPTDVADVVGMLTGPDGHWLTGQVVYATGGMA